MDPELLIIEDDRALNQMLAFHFEDQGYRIRQAYDCAQGMTAVRERAFDLVLLDQQLPDGLGVELLPRLLEERPDLDIVMMTAQHDLELAIRAIKLGAADFLHKPIKPEGLQTIVEQIRAKRTQIAAQESDGGAVAAPLSGLIGRSEAMLKVSKDIALSAEHAATLLITGESGTGKELVARLIHEHSGRSGPFVAVNCAAIVDTLLESELFGHEKGAFTGADARKTGRFEQACDGTLFLDEVAELALPLQAKLLRALQERTFERVGGTEPITSNARVIAATHRDLFAEAAAGDFREDLAYRLNVLRIQLPPLRARREDIPLLAAALLEQAAADSGIASVSITDAALARLAAHRWPGNVRELQNLLTQALVQARGGAIGPELLAFADDGEPAPTETTATPDLAATPPAIERSLDDVEAEHVQRVLDHTGGHKGRSCEILGISRPALDRKIKKYGLRLPD